MRWYSGKMLEIRMGGDGQSRGAGPSAAFDPCPPMRTIGGDTVESDWTLGGYSGGMG